jgi:mannose-6-phosphate isomerase-like protein (cupin superfamily)
MEAWELAELLRRRAASQRSYLEFIRSPSLSAGLYVLAGGATDRQQPHTEDEVYYVVSGRGRITVGEETRPVGAGCAIFVAATVPHRFHDIAEELRIVVVFAPPEGSTARTSG